MAWLSSFFIATVLFSTYMETNSFTTIRPFIHRSSCTVLYARRSQRTMDSSLSALGLERGATMDDAKKAYRKAAMRTHPDRNDTEAAAAEFREVSEAYAFIAGKGSTAAGTEAVVEAVADLATDFASFARDVLKVGFGDSWLVLLLFVSMCIYMRHHFMPHICTGHLFL